MERMELVINSLADLPAAAKKIIEWADNEKIICFYGEMGAGKTTLIKQICNQLGVTGSTSSPTFSLVNEYHTTDHKRIYHFDFYRIEKEEEAFDMGISEYLESGSVCLIEWPENIYNLLPGHFVKVEIEPNPDSARKITLTR